MNYTMNYTVRIPGPMSLGLPCILLLASCQNNSGPSPVENFVAMVDAQAVVQELQYQQQQANQARLARLAQNAYVRENDTLNVLYSPSGTVIYQGGPASESELVWVSPVGSAQQVTATTGNWGTYVAFTPQAIYVNQPAAGQVSRLPRTSTGSKAAASPGTASSSAPSVSAASPSAATKAASAPGAAASSPSAAGTYPANSLQALPGETPTSPSTEV